MVYPIGKDYRLGTNMHEIALGVMPDINLNQKSIADQSEAYLDAALQGQRQRDCMIVGKFSGMLPQIEGVVAEYGHQPYTLPNADYFSALFKNGARSHNGIYILDGEMHGEFGRQVDVSDVIGEIRKGHPEARIVVMTSTGAYSHDTEDTIRTSTEPNEQGLRRLLEDSFKGESFPRSRLYSLS